VNLLSRRQHILRPGGWGHGITHLRLAWARLGVVDSARLLVAHSVRLSPRLGRTALGNATSRLRKLG
jgi:hypothetical protein